MMRTILIAIAFLALALPPTSAHGIVFSADPTVFNLDGFLATDKTIQLATGAAGTVYFAAYQPGTAATPLDFVLTAPLRMIPHGADIQIQLISGSKPVYTQDSNSNSIRVELITNGAPIPGAKEDKALGPLLQPNSPTGVHSTLPTNVTAPIDANATLTLRLTPLMPALLDQSLAVVVGGDGGSTFRLPLFTVPTVQDLHFQDTTLEQYDISRSNFTPADPKLAINEIDVYHGAVTTNYVNVFGTRAYLVFKGAEPSNDAQEFHMFVERDRRMNATHNFLVGTTLVRSYPGLGVVVDLDLANGPLLLKCVQNCPAGGFQMTISPNRINQKPGDLGQPLGGTNATTTTPTSGGSTLDPPPSSATSTTPATKTVPGAPIAASLALAIALALRRH